MGEPKPQLDLSIIPNNVGMVPKGQIKEGIFSPYTGKVVHSRNGGGFFKNAKAAKMLERGWASKENSKYGKVDYTIKGGDEGLIAIYDGPEIQVNCIEPLHNNEEYKDVYTFMNIDTGHIFELEALDRNTEWIFYTRVKPVPFVNKSKMSRKRKLFSKKTRKQKGGFYPSVYGGITGAKMLTPLIARQMLRMYETSNRKTRRRKNKRRNERA